MSRETTDGTTLIALNPYGKANPSALSINTKIEPVSVEVCPPTPSPTEAEFNYLHNVKGRRNVMRWIRYIVPALLVFTVLILISVFKDQIVDGLKPFTDWMQQHNIAGAAIIIAAMVIVSFPPWAPLEVKSRVSLRSSTRVPPAAINLKQTTSSTVLWLTLCGREDCSSLSTPMFSTVGVPPHIFLAAAVLSVPKSFVPVYVGWSARPENDNLILVFADSKTAKILSKVVLAISLCITLATLYWIYRKMEQAKEGYIYSRRKVRQAKAAKGPVIVALNEKRPPILRVLAIWRLRERFKPAVQLPIYRWFSTNHKFQALCAAVALTRSCLNADYSNQMRARRSCALFVPPISDLFDYFRPTCGSLDVSVI
ncbi:hypothetical protein R3P38DRAFT_2780097 [Favolaschia claudopus]|uniref:Golgi apparatus membrane protein TVP38 n=1 Tax=Favolaschia claudopus TaxID=2862362 RepID=A0AAW0BCF5_9AGAR